MRPGSAGFFLFAIIGFVDVNQRIAVAGALLIASSGARGVSAPSFFRDAIFGVRKSTGYFHRWQRWPPKKYPAFAPWSRINLPKAGLLVRGKSVHARGEF